MKFAVLSYERKYLSLSGKAQQNLGDWIQTIATEELYKEWGITDYIHVSRNDAREYNGEYVLLPFNGFNTLIDKANYKTKTFPLSPKIIPVFFSMHYHDKYIPKKMLLQLIQYGPIGCRDEETMQNLRAQGIQSYLSGCVTALLPKRNPSINQNKILLVDPPNGIEEYIPSHFKKNIEYHTNMFRITRTTGEPYMTTEESSSAYNHAKDVLQYYKDNAALVVTSRLHVASPCMAMGIPVVLAKEDFDGRFAWIEKYLPLYSRKDWNIINWNPSPINYEEEKTFIKSVLKKQLFSTYNKFKDIYALSEFYESRCRVEYNQKIRQAIQSLQQEKNKPQNYAIWGVVDSSLLINNIIAEVYPEWNLSKVYDLRVEGNFEGINIQKPETITAENDLIYFIVATKARTDAKELLERINKKYIIVDLKSDSWENNL